MSLSLEDVALADRQLHVQIAVLTPAESTAALTRKTQARTVIHSRRDLQRDLARCRNMSRTAALPAGLLQDRPLAAAGRACLPHLEESAATNDDACAAAGLAGHAPRTRRRARAAAFGALLRQGELQLALAAEDRLVEVNLQAESHVVATTRPVGIRPALLSASTAKHLFEAAETAAEPAAAPAEDITEHGEDVVHVHAARTISARAALEGLMTELVVALAFLRIVEDIIRLGRFLELLLGRLVARIAVGMILHRQLAISRLDLIRGRRLRDAKDLVVISLLCHCLCSFQNL